MRMRAALLALVVAVVSIGAWGQASPVTGNESQPPAFATLPLCQNTANPTYKTAYKTTAPVGMYDCVAGVWTIHGTGSGTISGLNTNKVPKASNATTIIDSLCTEDATTFACTDAGGGSFLSVTTTGAGTADKYTEITPPATPTTGFGYNWFDSVGHDPEALNSSGQKFSMVGATEVADIGYWFPALAISAPTAQAVVTAGQQLRVTQVYLPFKLKVAHITARISGIVASSTVTACLYSSDGNTKLVDSGTFDGGTASTQTKTITAVTLPSGWYWFAQTASTQTTLTAFTFPNDTTLNGFIDNQTNKKQGTAANAATSGVCPATLGAISGGTYTILATDFEP